MVRPITDLEGHPDIVELRQRYDQVSETPVARITDGALVLAGIYLAISPWVVSFPPFEANLSANNFICGVAVALLAAGFAVAYGRTHGLAWVPAVIGVWTIVAPWVIQRGYATGGAIASNVVIGAIILVLALAAMRPGMLAGKKNARRTTGQYTGGGDRERGLGDRDRDRDRERGLGDRDRERGFGDRERGFGDRDRDRGYGERGGGIGESTTGPR
ncbi:SPW repeat protein [Dactylosporangium sp. CA-092794]|uniref:SPW repeat protein n=1 Tax=Dactylosporangium sp. CA-092794 TaxID=3239929 RepID=UPI003D91EC9A